MNKTTSKLGFIITILILVFTCLPAAFSFGQDKGTFVDARNGHTYRWIKFGKHAWMLGNLDYKTPAGSWVYSNDSTKELAYGRLYDWTTAQKACPKGWHMPADNDWNALISVLGGEDAAGEKFQAADTIPAAIRVTIKGGEADNLIAVLAGVRHSDGTFSGLGMWGGCWSSNHTNDVMNNFLFTRNGKAIGKSTNDKNTAFSVRCVRNK